jgi:ABC-2 type transport system permease protein
LVATSDRPGAIRRARQVWEYRELLGNLVRKELKVKYKNSILGFVWSLLNPALYLVVFYIVFQLILGSAIEKFPIFLLCGLIPWNFFSAAVAAGCMGITGNSSLVVKVWFPREILPLSAVGAAFVHYVLQSAVLIAALLLFRWMPAWEYVPLLIPALIAMAIFVVAMAIFLSAVNVYLRDTQHLLELALLAWFWLTPIVYPYQLVANKMGAYASLYLLNPMTSVVITYQRALYNKATTSTGTQILPNEPWTWYLRNLVLVIIASSVLLLVALWIFGRLEDNFAEEI